MSETIKHTFEERAEARKLDPEAFYFPSDQNPGQSAYSGTYKSHEDRRNAAILAVRERAQALRDHHLKGTKDE